MHICFLTNEYPQPGKPHGGIGTFVQTLGKGLVLAGHRVSVIGTGDSSQDALRADDGVQVYTTKAYKIKGLKALLNAKRINKKLREIHKTQSIDIVESNENGLAMVSKIRGIKYVMRMHGGHHFFTLFENRQRVKKNVWLEKRSFAKADHLFAVSKYVANITLKELSQPEREVTVIYNPIDTQKFRQVDYSKAIPQSLLFVGTVCEKKGIRQLVQALPTIQEQFPKVHLKIVGRDWFFANGNSYIEYLKREIPTSVKEHISFEGVVPNTEVVRYIETSEVCVYPSHMEAMPLAWLEVLSMGKPFIGSAIGPGFEAVSDGKTGLLCDPHDPKSIAEKVIWMLTNKEQAITMGKAARKDILERFNIETLIEKNVQAYDGLIKNG